MTQKRRATWDAQSVRGLRRHPSECRTSSRTSWGVRQQTVSEWRPALPPRGTPAAAWLLDHRRQGGLRTTRRAVSAPALRINEERTPYDVAGQPPDERPALSPIQLPTSNLQQPCFQPPPFQPSSAPHRGAAHSAVARGRRALRGDCRVALVTRAGVPVNVIFQGRGPGPGFRGGCSSRGRRARLCAATLEFCTCAPCFRAHGHADAAYRDVPHAFRRRKGRKPGLAGRRHGAGRRWRWGGAGAPASYSAGSERPLLWREPCSRRRHAHGGRGRGHRARRGGRPPLDTKACAGARDGESAAGLDQALYEGLLEAARLRRQRATDARLWRGRCWEIRCASAHARADPAWVRCCSAARGLLPSQRGHRGPASSRTSMRWSASTVGRGCRR